MPHGCNEMSGARTGYVHRLQTLCSLFNIELHHIAFLQAFVPIANDRLEVDKQVLSSFTLDKAIALGIVEPLHGTLFHTRGAFHNGEHV